MRDRPPQKKLIVAVVDDDESFRNAAHRMLEAASFQPRTFPSVVEFIQSGLPPHVNCLVLDVLMPEIDGVALVECLRDTNFAFPIILCTGLDEDDARRRIAFSERISYLQKPISGAQLESAIRTACLTTSLP